MIFDNGITILDPTMNKNEIRIIKSIESELGFKITNETGEHLYIEIKKRTGFLAPGEFDIDEIIVRK